MIAWICRTLDSPIGLQAWGLHSVTVASGGSAVMLGGVGCSWPTWSPTVLHYSTLVRTTRAVVHHRFAIAERTALSELLVKLLDCAGPQFGHPDVAKRRLDAPFEVASVAVEGRFLALVSLQPVLDDVGQRCPGRRVALLVHLRLEAPAWTGSPTTRGLKGCAMASTLRSVGVGSGADGPAGHLCQHELTPVRVTNRVTRSQEQPPQAAEAQTPRRNLDGSHALHQTTPFRHRLLAHVRRPNTHAASGAGGDDSDSSVAGSDSNTGSSFVMTATALS